MGEAANWTPNRPSLAASTSAQTTDSLAARLRWRLITRPARSISDGAALRINRTVRAAENQPLLRRWRPMSAPANPVPPWRWTGRFRAGRASRRAIGERWRALTVR